MDCGLKSALRNALQRTGAGAFGLSGWIVIRREELVITLRMCEGLAYPLLRWSSAAVTRADN